jgi:hypothetical protein
MVAFANVTFKTTAMKTMDGAEIRHLTVMPKLAPPTTVHQSQIVTTMAMVSCIARFAHGSIQVYV